MDPSSTHGAPLGEQESIGRGLLLLVGIQIHLPSFQPAGPAQVPNLLMPSPLDPYCLLQALVIWVLYLDLFLPVTSLPSYPWDIMQP